jgi:hypothetical protein
MATRLHRRGQRHLTSSVLLNRCFRDYGRKILAGALDQHVDDCPASGSDVLLDGGQEFECRFVTEKHQQPDDDLTVIPAKLTTKHVFIKYKQHETLH